MTNREPILSVKDLEIQFRLRGRTLTAIRRCSLAVYAGETLAIVGESGCGKTVLSKSFVGMLDPNAAITGGSIWYNGVDLTQLNSERDWLSIRGKQISMVMQDPMTALNPLKKIGKQIEESIRLHQGRTGAQARQEAIGLLNRVGIPEPERRYHQYPHELSGGMRQRVVIAIAVACRPNILICDEPTTALDVTIQAQILELIRSLQAELGMTVIYITHDLGVVANVADRVAVMYAGQIVEYGLVREIFHDAWHPYTWALLSSLPQLGRKDEALPVIDGRPPNLFDEIVGDAFAPRNKKALAIDFVKEPPFFRVSETHAAKTWYLDPRAPEIQRPQAMERLQERPEHRAAAATAHEKLLEIKDLQVAFGSGKKKFTAVDQVSFDIYKGETLALVGESGSGKTTLGRAILRLLATSAGEILLKGRKINGTLDKADRQEVVRTCQMIFQDPMASLNERATVESIISEGVLNYKLCPDKQERVAKVQAILREVGLSPEFASRFPHEFSGGQRQRIGIARALVMEPEFIVADEPVSALDVSIRGQILNLLNELKRTRQLTYLFITHDLSVVRFISDRIAVMSKGRIVELAEVEELFLHPLHPYTKALLSAIPQLDPERERKKKPPVYDPSLHDYTLDKPVWEEILPGHFVYGNQTELAQYRKERNGRG